MRSPLSVFKWLAFQPSGLHVSGAHSPVELKVPEVLKRFFDIEHPRTLAKVLATPGGFDGQCAVLSSWRHDSADSLQLQTGLRTYSQAMALNKLVTRAAPDWWLTPSVKDFEPSICWCSGLATVVLLPGNKLLGGLRGEHLQVNPNTWSCLFTEILEPKDVSPSDMTPLLDRLVSEELPTLQGLGKRYFVGLVFWPADYGTSLVSVLDLRAESPERVALALANLVPDEETQKWEALDLGQSHQEGEGIVGIELAADVHARLLDRAAA